MCEILEIISPKPSQFIKYSKGLPLPTWKRKNSLQIKSLEGINKSWEWDITWNQKFLTSGARLPTYTVVYWGLLSVISLFVASLTSSAKAKANKYDYFSCWASTSKKIIICKLITKSRLKHNSHREMEQKKLQSLKSSFSLINSHGKASNYLVSINDYHLVFFYETIFYMFPIILAVNFSCSPKVPFISSTTLLPSESCLSSLVPAPFVAQLQRICLLPSHFPEW